jgi:spore coat polysaccharide biosynthesis protein SpsF (cytidylyltransferase family)
MMALFLGMWMVALCDLSPWWFVVVIVAAIWDSAARNLRTRLMLELQRREMLQDMLTRVETMKASAEATLQRSAMPGEGDKQA